MKHSAIFGIYQQHKVKKLNTYEIFKDNTFSNCCKMGLSVQIEENARHPPYKAFRGIGLHRSLS